MKMIEPFLDLRHMFNATAVDLDDSHLMFLKGMVCYYGKHYVGIVFIILLFIDLFFYYFFFI